MVSSDNLPLLSLGDRGGNGHSGRHSNRGNDRLERVRVSLHASETKVEWVYAYVSTDCSGHGLGLRDGL